MTPHVSRSLLLVVALAALAGGCESARFGGRGPVVASTRPTISPAPLEPVAPSVPSGSVTSEPLPPLMGGPATADVPVMPGSPAPIEPMAPAAPAGPSRSSSVGSYTARDATGSTCRVSLSSSPALDLYRASASGCQNKDLARVTAWDYRDGEVYLYQPGGSVAARLRGSSASLTGVLAKSGAPLTLTR